MADERKTFGAQNEAAVVKVLRRKGYKIVARNFRTALGEIDIIAKHKRTLVFIEVKARRSTAYGDPKWAVTPAKQRTISKVALIYLKMNGGTHTKARFDVVTVQHSTEPPKVEIIPNAFELAYP